MPEDFAAFRPLAVLRMWAYLRFRAGQWLTLDEIAQGTGLSYDVVRNNLGRLIRNCPRIQVEYKRSPRPGRPSIARIRFQPIRKVIFGDEGNME